MKLQNQVYLEQREFLLHLEKGLKVIVTQNAFF